MRKNEEDLRSINMKWATNILVGAVTALIICILVLLFASWLVASGKLPESMITILPVAMCFIATFIGGMYASERNKTKKLFSGILTGLLYFVLLFIIGIIIYSSYSLANKGIAIFLASILGGTLAGLINANVKKSRKI